MHIATEIYYWCLSAFLKLEVLMAPAPKMFGIDISQEVSLELTELSPKADSSSWQYCASHLPPRIWRMLEVQGYFHVCF